MSWYDNGTISLVADSPVVSAVGTAFIANARPGDALQLPDGKLYEVATIDSATQLTLTKPYGGPSASNLSYALIPVQGYVRQLVVNTTRLLESFEGMDAAVEAAALSESNAAASEATALASQVASASSETAAAGSAADALASETAAAGSASTADGHRQAAASSAADALASEAAAASSASASAGSASAASASETSAAGSANSAAASEAAADVSEANALASANASAASAADALASKNAAAGSATTADGHRQAAAGSASDALASKNAAAGSATASANSASASSGSATAAAGSAAAAANSASEAAGYASSVNPANYYTKTQVDSALGSKAAVSVTDGLQASKAPKASPEFTGDIFLNGRQRHPAPTATTTAVDCSLNNVFDVAVNGAVTLTVSNIPTGFFTFLLKVNFVSGSLSLPPSFVWADATPLAPVAGKKYRVLCMTEDGTTVHAMWREFAS